MTRDADSEFVPCALADRLCLLDKVGTSEPEERPVGGPTEPSCPPVRRSSAGLRRARQSRTGAAGRRDHAPAAGASAWTVRRPVTRAAFRRCATALDRFVSLRRRPRWGHHSTTVRKAATEGHGAMLEVLTSPSTPPARCWSRGVKEPRGSLPAPSFLTGEESALSQVLRPGQWANGAWPGEARSSEDWSGHQTCPANHGRCGNCAASDARLNVVYPAGQVISLVTRWRRGHASGCPLVLQLS